MTFPTSYIIGSFKTTVADLIAKFFYTSARLIIASISAEIPGPGTRPEPLSFWNRVLSQRLAWHPVWLSVIQLWHYLFTGILNSLLTNLAVGDRVLVSSYTNAIAITQFFGVLCAPWNGLLMDCLKQKYQKEARKMGETKASEDQGSRMGEIFICLHAHLLFCS